MPAPNTVLCSVQVLRVSPERTVQSSISMAVLPLPLLSYRPLVRFRRNVLQIPKNNFKYDIKRHQGRPNNLGYCID